MKIDYAPTTDNAALDKWLTGLVDELRNPQLFEVQGPVKITGPTYISNYYFGNVGGWIVTPTTLQNGQITLDAANRQIVVDDIVIDGLENEIRVADKIKIDADTERVDVGDTEGTYIQVDGANTRVRSSNYVSGYAGAGFTLSPDLLEVGNIACRGIIRTAVFQKDVISVVGGNLWVRPADVLDTDMTAADSSTLTIEGNETFAVGDFLRIKDGTDDEWFEVTNIASAPTYTVTRDKAAQYAANSNPAWTKGASVVNYGQSGDGGVYVTSSETNAPYLSVYTQDATPWSGLTTQVRLGNLNGSFGISSDKYGFAAGDASLSDHYVIINGTDGTVTIKGALEVVGSDTYNMLTNPGFEEVDGDGDSYWWTTASYIETNTDGGEDSNNYLTITRDSGTDRLAYHLTSGNTIRYFEVNEGEVYEFGGDLRSDGVATARMALTYCDKDKSVSGNVVNETTSFSFEAKWNTYTVGSGIKFIRISVSAVTSNGVCDFDNLYLRKIDRLAYSWTSASDRTLIDGGNIYANTVTVVKLNSDATNRMFSDSTTATNVQGWVHVSDVTKIDGGDVYVGSNILVGSGATDGKISIANSTFGAAGIQLHRTSSKNYIYAGDGSSEYLKYTTDDGVQISTAKANAITMKTGSDIVFEPSDSSPSEIIFKDSGAGTYDIKFSRDATYDRLTIAPTTTDTCQLYLGGGPAVTRFSSIAGFTSGGFSFYAQDSGNDQAVVEGSVTYLNFSTTDDSEGTSSQIEVKAAAIPYIDFTTDNLRLSSSGIAAGDAANNSLYISSADSKLYWKDSGGTSHALY